MFFHGRLSSRSIISVLREKGHVPTSVLPRDRRWPSLCRVHTPWLGLWTAGWQPIRIVWLESGRGDFLQGKEEGCCFQKEMAYVHCKDLCLLMQKDRKKMSLGQFEYLLNGKKKCYKASSYPLRTIKR